ncbi:MAG: hypothetical protein H6700_05770 [Myxococcales bacterium]|nr:hypothetical protein [Myxococcales bacterium]
MTTKGSAARRPGAWAGAALALATWGSGCADEVDDRGAPPYETLSEYGFFEAPLVDLQPVDGVIEYIPASPLWADFADKGRFLVLPRGAQIDPRGDDEDWEFPLGTVLVKTFLLAGDRRDPIETSRVVETRLLVRDETERGWSAYTYVWNEAQTDATRVIAGRRLTFEVVDEAGATTEQVYVVPNENQCRDCHARDDRTVVLGFNSLQLDHERAFGDATANQLERLDALGVFSTPPTRTEAALVSPRDESASVEWRARSYLHANCSHCHRPGGDGGRSGLDLRAYQTEPGHYGVCKPPAAAGAGAGGRSYDIVPGRPDSSILPFRMASLDPEARMPELPSRLRDELGIELVRAWIAGLDGDPCGLP